MARQWPGIQNIPLALDAIDLRVQRACSIPRREGSGDGREWSGRAWTMVADDVRRRIPVRGAQDIRLLTSVATQARSGSAVGAASL